VTLYQAWVNHIGLSWFIRIYNIDPCLGTLKSLRKTLNIGWK
jgi:hypothetical protein